MKFAIEMGPVVVIASARSFANVVDHFLAIADEYLAFLHVRAKPTLRNSGRSFFVAFATMSSFGVFTSTERRILDTTLYNPGIKVTVKYTKQ